MPSPRSSEALLEGTDHLAKLCRRLLGDCSHITQVLNLNVQLLDGCRQGFRRGTRLLTFACCFRNAPGHGTEQSYYLFVIAIWCSTTRATTSSSVTRLSLA